MLWCIFASTCETTYPVDGKNTVYKNPLYKSYETQKALKIKNFLRIMLKLVVSHLELLHCYHIVLLIFICTYLLSLKNIFFLSCSIKKNLFLSIFLELILIKIDSLMNPEIPIKCLCNLILKLGLESGKNHSRLNHLVLLRITRLKQILSILNLV